MVSDIDSITTPSPTKVVIKLKAPNSAFLDYLASAYGPKMMSPTGLAANAGTDHDQKYITTHDLGTGPYTLDQGAGRSGVRDEGVRRLVGRRSRSSRPSRCR